MKKMRNFIKKYQLILFILGVAFVPALYNLSFLGSMWDPYSNVKNLPVAVVNKDKSYSVNGKSLSIGEDITEKMKSSKALDYQFVNESNAKEGLKQGKYYMVVTLPSELSKDASSLLTTSPKKMTIIYETAQGNNLFASKISNSAMEKLKTSVSSNVTETYVKSVFSQLTKLNNGISKLVSGGGKLSDGSHQLNQGGITLTNGIGKLSDGGQQLSVGADKLLSGLRTYTSGVDELSNGNTILSKGLISYTGGVSQLANGSKQLNNSSETLLNGFQSLSNGTNQIEKLTTGLENLEKGLEGVSKLTKGSLQELSKISDQLKQFTSQESSSNISSLNTELSNLSINIKQALNNQESQLNHQIISLKTTSAYQSLSDEQKTELVNALSSEDTSIYTTIQNNLSTITKLLSNFTPPELQMTQDSLVKTDQYIGQLDTVVSNQLISGTQQLLSGTRVLQTGLLEGGMSLQTGLEKYTSAVSNLNTGLNQLNNNSEQLLNGISQLQSGSQSLSSNSSKLISGSQQLVSGIDAENSGIGSLFSGSSQLSNGLTDLSAGILNLNAGLKTIENQLSLVSMTDKNADKVAYPTRLLHNDNDSVSVNGVAMAPYMISVSLMVIALSANVIFEKLLYGSESDNKKKNIKKKLLINGVIAILDSIILYITIHFMGVNMEHPILTFAMILLGSYVFMAMVTLLILISDQFGSFFALLLLLLQTGSAGGSYPIELSPGIFQALNPYLPMSYLVSGLRQTISRTGQINHQLIVLTIFLISFLGIIYFIYSRKTLQDR